MKSFLLLLLLLLPIIFSVYTFKFLKYHSNNKMSMHSLIDLYKQIQITNYICFYIHYNLRVKFLIFFSLFQIKSQMQSLDVTLLHAKYWNKNILNSLFFFLLHLLRNYLSTQSFICYTTPLFVSSQLHLITNEF